ncbi:MAG TPA: hypothetical protein VK774_01040 [Solirubrobacteraceae bacterium]|nr:hypothetical protein [Solirubrobacteraceae bacterium]
MSRFSDRLHAHSAEGRLAGKWSDFTRRVEQERRGQIGHDHVQFKGDRATRSRWVNGKALPRCRECVAALADILGDEELLDAWEREGTRRDEQGQLTKTLSQIATLPMPFQRKVQEQLRVDLQETEFATRETLRIKVRIARCTAAVHRVEASVRWRGELPARARILFASDRDELNEAYADESCVYRDLLHLDANALSAGYAQLAKREGGRPLNELRVKPVGEREWRTFAAASASSPGCFEFDNKRADEADIQLSVTFPMPTHYACYPIQFGSYRVRGVASATLGLAADISPKAAELLVLPPSCQTAVDCDSGSVSVELGEPDSLLPTDATIFFYWGITNAR